MSLKTKNVVFITGAFVTHRGWDPWIDYFKQHGYAAIAPAWLFKEGPAQELREKHDKGQDTDLALLTLSELIDEFANIAKSFDEKPVLIGHSTGGLVTQILVNRDLASAGVVIHSAPTLGVLPYEPSFLWAGWESLGFVTSLKKTYLMSFKKFQYAFVNGMPLEEQKKAYEENTIPESKTFVRGALTKAAAVDYDKPHPPLLFMSGSTDHIIPAHLNQRNFNRYNKDNDSITDYKEFPGRNHFVLGQSTWKEDADYIFDWLKALPDSPGGHRAVA